MILSKNLPYILTFILFAISLYGLIISKNYFKKLVCLSLLQSSVIIFYILVAYIKGSKAPFLNGSLTVNPLPHVLMLTAIVVGLAILSVGLSLTLRLKEEFHSIEEDEVTDILSQEDEVE